jgi:microcystin-dependent protein
MEIFLGQIILLPYNFAPVGFAMCTGETLSIAQNAALFSLLGTTYGGDGVKTFKLPDFSKVTNLPAGCHYYIALQGIYPSRS